MIKNLKLHNVGPAKTIELADMGDRLNLISGDNGLGKSFLLDTAWWALTRKWPAEINPKLISGKMARPYSEGEAKIEFTFSGKTKTEDYASSFDRKKQSWTGRAGRPPNPGLVLYAMADGSFALWDPARNYWQQNGDIDVQERQAAYVFNPSQVWYGLPGDKSSMLCNGLVSDWAGWQKEKGTTFKKLCGILEQLSPSTKEKIEPGELTRIAIDDVRDIPTLKMAYGQSVPVLHASSGMRRIIALAYFLVWAWEEHVKASKQLDETPTHQIVFLVDEIESHLHPKWQRKIIPALLETVKVLAKNATAQVIAVTHSPLIMASAEPLFDENKDAWFDIDLVGKKVELTKRQFSRQGDYVSWLTSEAFDMKSGRSLEAEEALEQAAKAMSSDEIDPKKAKSIDTKLRKVLGETDPFWLRWSYVAEKKGWLA